MDSDAVTLCSDEQLQSMGVLAYGDLLALRNYVAIKMTNKAGGIKTLDTTERKKELIATIRSGKVNDFLSKKKTYKITIGWKHYKHGKYVSVRRCGGTRTVNVDISTSFTAIKEVAINLFFPDGKNFMGKLKDFDVLIGNFSAIPVEEFVPGDSGAFVEYTLLDYIQRHKLTHIRLYLLTKTTSFLELINRDSSSDDDFELDPFVKKSKNVELTKPKKVVPVDEDISFLFNNSSFDSTYNQTTGNNHTSQLIGSSSERQALHEEIQSAYQESLRKDQNKLLQAKITEEAEIDTDTSNEIKKLRNSRKDRVLPQVDLKEDHIVVTVKHDILGNIRRLFSPDSLFQQVYDWVGSLDESPLHFYLCKTPSNVISPNEEVAGCIDVLHIQVTDNPIELVTKNNYYFEEIENKREAERKKLSMKSLVATNQTSFVVNRHNILEDIFKVYENQITDCIISFIFEDECAIGDGVTREAFSLFFRDLFQLKSSGVNANVPVNLSALQSTCLGRLITHSFIQSNFFPVNLAKACFEYMIYGNVREATLISSFLQFVQENEKILLEKFLNQESTLFSGDEKEIIWEVLIDAGVSAIPTPKSIKELVLKAAKCVFIERPCFLLLHMKEGLGDFWSDMPPEGLDILWSRYTPNRENVMKYFVIEPRNSNEEAVYSYFIRYIRSLSVESLSLLVQYCTGSSIVDPGACIKVIFDNQDSRHLYLRAASCFKILYLPRHVASYQIFRTMCETTLNNKSLWAMSG